jgi:putative FmdB family regulatory protein
VPTYDYECTRCGERTSVQQSMYDKPLKRCRKCGGKLEKLLPQSINLIFKGSGFYITDYKKQSDRQAKGDSAAGGSKEAPKTDMPKSDGRTCE